MFRSFPRKRESMWACSAVTEGSGSPLSRGRADVGGVRADAHGGRISEIAQRRAPRLSRRRTACKDVTAHPAFRQAARSIAALFDIAADPEQRERMTFASPKTGAARLARLADPEDGGRSARAAALFRNLGRGDLRPDGPRARPCRGLLRRLRRGAEILRRARASNSPTISSPSTNSCATSTSIAATPSCRRRSTAQNPRISRATRRFMPAWSKSATTASSFPAPSSSPPAAPSPITSI